MEPVSDRWSCGREPVSRVLELSDGACVYGDRACVCVAGVRGCSLCLWCGACVYGDGACVYGNHSIIKSPQVPCPFWDFFGTLGLGLNALSVMVKVEGQHDWEWSRGHS